jgi:hypothetical protein
MIREGQRVSFVGWPNGQQAVGDKGLVLDVPGSHAYVRWTTGTRINEIDLVRVGDLVAAEDNGNPIVARHKMSEDQLGFWSDDLAPMSGSLDDYESWD